MDYYLGLDGGGTKTAAVIIDADGIELGRGNGGPCNIVTNDDALLSRSVAGAFLGALKAAGLPQETPFKSVCAGVAGYSAKTRRADFLRSLIAIAPAESHRIEPDFVIAYWGATEGAPGIVVIAGTGAVVYGRNAAGHSCRVDGRGWLLGDRGGGFDIGKTVLSYALRTLDEGHPIDEFTLLVLEHLGVEDADGLVAWVYRDFSPERIAGLAKVVGSWADQGNPAARFMLGSPVSALTASVLSALHRLETDANEIPIYLLGGLWSAWKAFRGDFTNSLARRASDDPESAPITLDVRDPLHDAAYGAALLALRDDHQG